MSLFINRLQHQFRRFSAAMENVINMGVDAKTNDTDRKRVRLVNFISAWTIFIFFLYALDYYYIGVMYVAVESTVGVFGYCVPLWLNYRRKYNAACHFHCIFNLVFYLFMGVANGGIDGVEYILVLSSIVPMLFFRQFYIYFTYSFLNYAAFVFCKLSHKFIKPLFYFDGYGNIYNSNHFVLFSVLFLIVYYFKMENRRQEKVLEQNNDRISLEKRKSDGLLLNILPFETAEELKTTGKAKTKYFKEATVLFTDFHNFTKMAESMHPEELVARINEYFSRFDRIIEQYNLEKIKTIGDAYMAVGGIPAENDHHPNDVVSAALEMASVVQELKEESIQNGSLYFEMRAGIHTGPLVAGIVGTKKFAYDVWGDTVNVASRMESSGVVGKINISHTTYERVKEYFHCSFRGKLEAKNKGTIDMYFVDGTVESKINRLPKVLHEIPSAFQPAINNTDSK